MNQEEEEGKGKDELKEIDTNSNESGGGRE